MPLTRSYPLDSGFPNALDLRRLDAGLIAREGVFPDPTTTAAAGIAFGNGAWNVGARVFVAALKRGSAPYSLTHGVARVANASAGTEWAIPAAPVSGSRIDLLWIRATDTTQGETTSGTDGPGGVARAVPIFGQTNGVAAGVPAAPALPAGALLIATVTTPSGAASIAGSTIVQSYDFTHLVGGLAYYRTTAAMRADVAGLAPGQQCVVIATGLYHSLIAGDWRRETLGDHGEYTLLANAAASNVVFVTGTVTVDPSLTFRDPVSATGSGTITLADAGVYLIEFYASVGAAVTGRTYLALKAGATTLARSTIGTGEDQGFVAATVYRAAAGVEIGAEFLKNTGGTSNISGRIRVTRIG